MPYATSRDYARLWREMQTETIVCFADWHSCAHRKDGPPYRDVCSAKRHMDVAVIGCRGVTYVWAENGADFVKACQEAGIEAIFPGA